jgi:hypothetical protein
LLPGSAVEPDERIPFALVEELIQAVADIPVWHVYRCIVYSIRQKNIETFDEDQARVRAAMKDIFGTGHEIYKVAPFNHRSSILIVLGLCGRSTQH